MVDGPSFCTTTLSGTDSPNCCLLFRGRAGAYKKYITIKSQYHYNNELGYYHCAVSCVTTSEIPGGGGEMPCGHISTFYFGCT